MDQDKIKEILDNHALWLKGEGGERANLYGANLYGADLYEAAGILPISCPEQGVFIGWKKVNGGLIVKLKITETARRSSATTRKCRCSEAEVLEIQNSDGTNAEVDHATSTYDKNFIYKIGETVSVDNFNEDRWNECSAGIHFFITRQAAVEY